jgi:hypothetical protein
MIDNVSFGSAMFTLPEYTSPPLSEALEATPIEWRSDEAIQAKRDSAAHKTCGIGAAIDGPQEFCQLGFPGHAATGVILYGGAMMDPRSYSPLARMFRHGTVSLSSCQFLKGIWLGTIDHVPQVEWTLLELSFPKWIDGYWRDTPSEP